MRRGTYRDCDRCNRATAHELVDGVLRCEDCHHVRCWNHNLETDAYGFRACLTCREVR